MLGSGCGLFIYQEKIIMPHYRDSEESRTPVSVVLDIIDGRPWNARFVRNNHLRQHCRLLGKIFGRSHALTDPLRPAARRLFDRISRASDLLTAIHPSEFPLVTALVRMAAYHAKWIRDPCGWSPDVGMAPRQQLDSLAAHLFAKWSMPEWFGSAWFVKGELSYLERDWYCHVASGGSLRNVAGMPPSITSRALHLAFGAPGNLTVREALRWGQVKSLAGSDEVLAEVLKSRMVFDLSNDAVWSRLIEKAIRAKGFDSRDFGLIADALVEAIRNEGWLRAEALVGRPLSELLGYSRRFWKAVAMSGADVMPEVGAMDIRSANVRMQLGQLFSLRWARMPYMRDFKLSQQDRDGSSNWSVEELTCQAQLIAESREMRHCVRSYRQKCHDARSSIFSLRRTREKNGETLKEWHLTIEVDRRSRRVVQVRGRWNRYGTAEEFGVLRKWANRSGLIV